jgi:homocysteine S-methyltransferase
MLQAVGLAATARKCFLASRPDLARDRVKIALSLGSFGSAVQPAQEFDGYYPPPYGPQAFIPEGPNRNSYSNTEKYLGDEENSIRHLAIFHLERLRVFAFNHQAWNELDAVAFETVPLTREIIAIRRAVGELIKESQAIDPHFHMKAWWVSTVYPAGALPERTHPDESRVSIPSVVAVSLQHQQDQPVPTALAVNCTRLETLGDIVESMEKSLKPCDVSAPGLVLYPNGGAIYDPIHQAWSEEIAGSWSQDLVRLTQSINARGVWKALLVGGCCKTGPEDIRALARALTE